MRKPFFNLSLYDEALKEIASRYGGWPRLLDPTQTTPDEFIAELEDAGYSPDGFESIKLRIGKPEKQYWIAVIAYIVKKMNSEPNLVGHQQLLDEFLPKMNEHKITDEEIRNAVDACSLPY